MRVAIIAPSPRPFVFGGAERLWLDLTLALNRLTPHEVELIKVPSPERDLREVVCSYQRFWALDVGDFDAVVVTKYPAWMVRHPRKVVYMQHKLRGLYDTYPAQRLGADWKSLLGKDDAALDRLLGCARAFGGNGLPDSAVPELLDAVLDGLSRWPADDPRSAFPGPVARAVVHALDEWALAPEKVSRYAAISRTVAQREGYFPAGVAVHVAPHPSGLRPLPRTPEDGTAGSPLRGCRFLAVSRLDRAKRMDWVIRAFQLARTDGDTLTIVGDGPMGAALRDLAATVPGVTMEGRLSDEALASCYADHDVVVFVPLQEDMGLVTLEAMAAGCPVVTTRDSGGVAEFVIDGVNGWVAEPHVPALAQGMQRAAAAVRGGALGPLRERCTTTAAMVTWEGVIDAMGLRPVALRSGHREAGFPRQPGGRARVLVLAPFGLSPPRGGGANRIYHLYRELSRWVDVHVLCLGSESRVTVSTPHFVVEEIAAEADWRAQARQWRERLAVPADDIAMLADANALVAYRQAVDGALRHANALVLTHPWAAHCVPREVTIPVVYDAHNVEWRMKAAMWSHRGEPAAVQRAVELTRATEYALVERSAVIACVCEHDVRTFVTDFRDVAQPNRFVVVPNGVEPWPAALPDAQLRTALKQRLLGNVDHSALVLFVGSLHWPNVEGLLALHRAIVGNTDARAPVWAVAGSVCRAPELAPLWQHPNIKPLGVLDDATLRQWLMAADFGANPMLSGGGTNLKLLQYGMAGAAIVTTPYGLRGYPQAAPPWAMIGAVEDFSRLVQNAVTHPLWLEVLRRRARRVSLEYIWPVIARRYADALGAILPVDSQAKDRQKDVNAAVIV